MDHEYCLRVDSCITLIILVSGVYSSSFSTWSLLNWTLKSWLLLASCFCSFWIREGLIYFEEVQMLSSVTPWLSYTSALAGWKLFNGGYSSSFSTWSLLIWAFKSWLLLASCFCSFWIRKDLIYFEEVIETLSRQHDYPWE